MAIDWNKVDFNYSKANTMLACIYSNGKWGAVTSMTSDHLDLAACSPSLHYSMSCFEGLKAFRGVDGKVRIFRADENAARLRRSADFLGIPCPDNELFISMCIRAVEENLDFLPPYETRKSMYIRPILIETIPSVKLVPQDDQVLFLVMVMPVGAYATGLQGMDTVIVRDYDRAAPNGSGAYKVSANYAAPMRPTRIAHNMGYKDILYLNAADHRYIEEFSSANFFAIKGNQYITPDSSSVLPSITNKSLRQIAADMGMDVQMRKIAPEELGSFDEVNQCGTAVVITPVKKIDDKVALEAPGVAVSHIYEYEDGCCGAISRRLYDTVTGIQYGELADTHNWCIIL